MSSASSSRKRKTITVYKKEYDALVHNFQVISEYLQGEFESFDKAEDLIKNLKSL